MRILIGLLLFCSQAFATIFHQPAFFENTVSVQSLTGPLKGTGGVVTTAGASDIVGLFGSCTGVQYLGVDGNCHTALSNPMTTIGDIITGGSSGAPQRLAVGAQNQILVTSGAVPVWGPRIEMGFFAGANASSNCTSSTCNLYYGSTTGISSVTRNTTGSYTINFSPAYSQPPVCLFTSISTTAASCAQLLVPSVNGYNFLIFNCLNANAEDGFGSFFCIGVK